MFLSEVCVFVCLWKWLGSKACFMYVLCMFYFDSYITLFKCAESLAAAEATAALRLHCVISTLCISTMKSRNEIRNEIPSNTHENVVLRPVLRHVL